MKARILPHGKFGALGLTALSCLLFASIHGAPVPAAAMATGQTFATPEQAVAALAGAVHAKDPVRLQAIFGPAITEIKNPDAVQATNEFNAFAAAFDQTNHVAHVSDARCVLEVGAEGWPFPIPLVKQGGQWFFDTKAGKEEILNRRIGRNELATLEAVRAYLAAQREYASRDRNGDEVLEYAQKLVSSPGKKDGLYWPLELDGELSPLGPLVAQAQEQGYAVRPREPNAPPVPFHGYHFKILTRQGRHAAGGKYSYLINGRMIGGFALVAWPAVYGESGIMTFIINQQGRVYQKDLGPQTAKLAGRMKDYDPDRTWQISPD